MTNTRTPTKTPTGTRTPTDTYTPTDTRTFTPTFTSTNTRTFTNTSTATNTPTITPTNTPDITISKSASESLAKAGDVVTYTLTLVVTASTANNVQVTDQLPGHLNYDGAGPVPGGGTFNWNVSTSTMTWTWPTLAPGTYQVTYWGTVDNFITGGTQLINKADLSYEGLTGVKEASATVSIASIYTVKVGVYNEAGELIKEIWVQQMSQEIKGFDIAATPTITSLNGKIYVVYNGVEIATWDGTDQNGDPVTNGQYYVKVDNVNSYGVDDSVSKMVLVNRSIAKIQVNIYNEAGEVVRHLVSYADDPGNLSLSGVNLSANVIQPSETTGAGSAVTITSSNGMTIIWDGKSDTGSIVNNGTYQVELHYTDGKGGEQVFTRSIMVKSSNQSITSGKVYAKPNLLSKGATKTTITVNSTTPFTLVAHIYDVAGELLFTSKPGFGSVDLDFSGVSSGLYFVATDLINAEGGIAGKQVTQIVIQR